MSVKIACHQPYLFPYFGYFKLIKSVDKFVIYDDAKWMKQSWINRNYFPELFTFRVKNHSDYAKINECYFFEIEEDKKRFKRKFPKLQHKYLDLLEQDENIALCISFTIKAICNELGITTPIFFSSDIPHGKFAEGIVDIVKVLGGDTYINAPGGKSLYTQEMFGDIKLEFIETKISPSILCEL